MVSCFLLTVHQPPRRFGWWATALVLVVGTVRIGAIRGLIFPVRIAGGSMATTLVGTHLDLRCDDCDFPFECDAEPLPPTLHVVCPNCGFHQPLDGRQSPVPGQRVLIDQMAYHWRAPRRGELIAFRDPVDANRLSVKRLIGLPGEEVTVQSGDLFINRRRVHRTLDEQKQLAQCVYDDAYRGRRAPLRWRGGLPSSQWVARDGGFHNSGRPDRGDEAFDWLLYHHRSSYRGPAQGLENPIRDNCGYNQAVSRSLNTVRDLMLTCRIWLGAGVNQVAFSIHDGSDMLETEVRLADHRLILRRNDRMLATAAWPLDRQDRWLRVEYSTFDRQVQFAVDGRTLLQSQLPVDDRPARPTSCPVGIGVCGGAVEIKELRLYRDIYYLPPIGQAAWTVDNPVGDARWIVLGDNPAISVDSRHWAEAGLPRRLVVGRVLRVGSSREMDHGP